MPLWAPIGSLMDRHVRETRAPGMPEYIKVFPLSGNPRDPGRPPLRAVPMAWRDAGDRQFIGSIHRFIGNSVF
jgi:hypothetical protein